MWLLHTLKKMKVFEAHILSRAVRLTVELNDKEGEHTWKAPLKDLFDSLVFMFLLPCT